MKSFLRATARTALVVVATTAGTACYSYMPIDGPAVVGSEVRARLTRETALDQSELTGVLTQNYQGRVMAITSDSIRLSIVSGRAIGPTQTQTARRIVGLPMTGVQGLEERKLSGARTALAVAGAGAVVAAVVGGVLVGGGDSGGDGGNGDNAFRPIFGFRWPF